MNITIDMPIPQVGQRVKTILPLYFDGGWVPAGRDGVVTKVEVLGEPGELDNDARILVKFTDGKIGGLENEDNAYLFYPECGPHHNEFEMPALMDFHHHMEYVK